MPEHVYGHTKSGEPITDETIEQLADETERGYEPGQLRSRHRGPGRPPLGEAAKAVESVRLEPALRAAAAQWAEAEGRPVSEVICQAQNEYLRCA